MARREFGLDREALMVRHGMWKRELGLGLAKFDTECQCTFCDVDVDVDADRAYQLGFAPAQSVGCAVACPAMYGL